MDNDAIEKAFYTDVGPVGAYLALHTWETPFVVCIDGEVDEETLEHIFKALKKANMIKQNPAL